MLNYQRVNGKHVNMISKTQWTIVTTRINLVTVLSWLETYLAIPKWGTKCLGISPGCFQPFPRHHGFLVDDDLETMKCQKRFGVVIARKGQDIFDFWQTDPWSCNKRIRLDGFWDADCSWKEHTIIKCSIFTLIWLCLIDVAFWYSTMKTDKAKQLKEEILIKPIIRILTHFTLDGWKAVGRAFFLCVVSRNEAQPLAISWSPRTVWSKVLISNLLWVASDLSVLMESEPCSQVLPSRQLGKSLAYHWNMKQQQCTRSVFGPCAQRLADSQISLGPLPTATKHAISPRCDTMAGMITKIKIIIFGLVNRLLV